MMKLKAGLTLLILFLVCGNISFAGKLISQEAVNYFNEGVRAQKTYNFFAANVSFQKALLVDPNNPKWHKAILNNQGIMCVQEEDFEKAEAFFSKALEIDPDYKLAQLNLGKVYDKTKSRLEALEYWAKVFKIDKLKPKDFAIEDEQVIEEVK
jgi:tetratricopeptide (TPR) repeat protein